MVSPTTFAPCNRIAVVLAPRFGHGLIDLARDRHVWVVSSAENDEVIHNFWRGQPVAASAHWAASGFSLLGADLRAPAAETWALFLETLDEHHGEFGQAPPWSEIEVVGAPPTVPLLEEFKTIGVTELRPTPGGFVCSVTRTAVPSTFHQVKRVETQFAMPHTHYNTAIGEALSIPHVHDDSPGYVRHALPDELPRSGARTGSGERP